MVCMHALLQDNRAKKQAEQAAAAAEAQGRQSAYYDPVLGGISVGALPRGVDVDDGE